MATVFKTERKNYKKPKGFDKSENYKILSNRRKSRYEEVKRIETKVEDDLTVKNVIVYPTNDTFEYHNPADQFIIDNKGIRSRKLLKKQHLKTNGESKREITFYEPNINFTEDAVIKKSKHQKNLPKNDTYFKSDKRRCANLPLGTSENVLKKRTPKLTLKSIKSKDKFISNCRRAKFVDV